MPASAGDTVDGNLLMQVSAQSFAYAVVTTGGVLGVYEKFTFQNGAPQDLPGLITGLPWMHKKYNQVKTAWFTQEATLVPAPLYKTDGATAHLDLLYGDLGQVKSLADFVAPENLYCIYRLHHNLLRPVVRNFPVGGFWHVLSLMLGDAPPVAPEDCMRLHFMQDACCMGLYRERRLVAAKALSFSHYMEVVYKLLGFCGVHAFNPDDMYTVVSGDISAGAPLHDELRKYIRNIEFLATGFSVADQSCPPHFFHLFRLLNQAF